jgi:hypothetical protein
MSLSEVETLQLIALLSTRIAAVKQTIEGLDDQRLRLQNELNALTMAQEAVQHSILGSVQQHVLEVKQGVPPVKRAIVSPARKVPTKKTPIPDSSSSDDDDDEDVQPQRRAVKAPVPHPSTSDAQVEQVEAATKEMDALREAILKACGVNGDLPPKATAAGSLPSKKHLDPSREGSDSSFDDEVEEVRRLK